MGRNLHYSIIHFFEKSLDDHAMVSSWERIDSQEEDQDYLYKIRRSKTPSALIVHLTDKYEYSLTDFFQKLEQLEEASFVYVARPEARYDHAIVEHARNEKISIGKFGALMGALYIDDHWNYVPKERRKN